MAPDRVVRLAESARQLADIVEQLVDELDNEPLDLDADILADVYRLRVIAGRIEARTYAAQCADDEPDDPDRTA